MKNIPEYSKVDEAVNLLRDTENPCPDEVDVILLPESAQSFSTVIDTGHLADIRCGTRLQDLFAHNFTKGINGSGCLASGTANLFAVTAIYTEG
jgi:hypothetical protein